ncbi:uncharacterized protein PAC_04557 [Phialocephala subalpina]|uniref:BZIP domain-containing protein n=1 Tax=Phialocephala subalpina TaxID=576137 RepID=A0A1L7WPH5_9HELO|nr:uncharacterized protein PAC_04557 [Phialocephala subalpina]
MPQANPIAEALDFEWNVFEQFLEWHHMTPEALSPESISYNTTYNGSPPERAISAIENDTRSPSPPSPEDGPEPSPAETSAGSLSKSSTAYSRRRSQNRVAQRAFRARQRQHVEALEEKLKSVLSEYEQLQQRYTTLSIAYEALLEDKGMKGTRSVTCMSYDSSWSPENVSVFGGIEADGLAGMMFSDLEGADERF